MKQKWMSMLLVLVLLLSTATAVAAVGSEPALSGAISESGITVQVENLSADARLVIAQYHYGQMVDVVTKNISCDGSYTITAQKLVKGDEFKLFLSDKESSAPLCKAVLPVQTEDLLITESATVNEGSYRNVTIAASVGDGDVTFNNVTIYGDLLVEGGGPNTVSMSGCHVHGKVNQDLTQRAMQRMGRNSSERKSVLTGKHLFHGVGNSKIENVSTVFSHCFRNGESRINMSSGSSAGNNGSHG